MRSTVRRRTYVAPVSKDFPHPFSDLASRYRAFRRKAPALVSGIAVNEFRANFRRQGYRKTKSGVEKWVARKVNTGSAGRAILIKSGRLRRAIRSAPTYKEARVIINVPYAAIHNRGGKLRGFERVWATALKSKRTTLRSNKGGTPAKMPARPFAITTPPLLDDISNALLNGLQKEVFTPAKSA